MQWWLQIGGKSRQGSVRVGLHGGLARHLGNAMPTKTTPQRPKRKKSKANSLPSSAASMLSVATQNLINMVAVSAVSGTVLLGLLAAKHF
ncbi:hypothetical protein ACFLEY_08520 [Bradyrhizobium sp. YCK136]|uniref:hypothetical protein n=1 Tax=Bradyrhizobium TaxID=374 RepID=UPI001B8CEB1C|nr:hypothetical protein [Bradyrhizobium diazoefficiens]MBR0868439.1 hypothetical protein [Bradyrhizobium diazoefficiens]MBR0892991.1 hypothetical protein [Bradyrhizobium diazoefficiens]MBR0924631.1 hypothetical protein [Bradyrhizobium diazoefficiens]